MANQMRPVAEVVEHKPEEFDLNEEEQKRYLQYLKERKQREQQLRKVKEEQGKDPKVTRQEAVEIKDSLRPKYQSILQKKSAKAACQRRIPCKWSVNIRDTAKDTETAGKIVYESPVFFPSEFHAARCGQRLVKRWTDAGCPNDPSVFAQRRGVQIPVELLEDS